MRRNDSKPQNFNWIVYKYLKDLRKCDTCLSMISFKTEFPCKHAIISCQYRTCTDPMLTASAQYRPGTGIKRHVYGVCDLGTVLFKQLLKLTAQVTKRIHIPICHHTKSNIIPEQFKLGNLYDIRD